MPSLHVGAQAFLAIWAARRSKRLARTLWALTAVTVLGSLVTGWHYAIDGYAGLALAGAIAWLFGRATWQRSFANGQDLERAGGLDHTPSFASKPAQRTLRTFPFPSA